MTPVSNDLLCFSLVCCAEKVSELNNRPVVRLFGTRVGGTHAVYYESIKRELKWSPISQWGGAIHKSRFLFFRYSCMVRRETTAVLIVIICMIEHVYSFQASKLLSRPSTLLSRPRRNSGARFRTLALYSRAPQGEGLSPESDKDSIFEEARKARDAAEEAAERAAALRKLPSLHCHVFPCRLCHIVLACT